MHQRLYSVAADIVLGIGIFSNKHINHRAAICVLIMTFFNTPIIRLMPATVRFVRSTVVIKIPVTNLPQCQTSRFIHRTPVHV